MKTMHLDQSGKVLQAGLCSTRMAEDLHEDMTAFAKKLAKNPAAARDFLQRAGIVTRTGKLAKAYGG